MLAAENSRPPHPIANCSFHLPPFSFPPLPTDVGTRVHASAGTRRHLTAPRERLHPHALLHFPLPSPPASSLRDGPDPESDSLRAASPTVTRFLATAVTDPLFESTAVSALVAELVDFAATCRLDYAASLVAQSASASLCPPSVGGECALGPDVLEERQEEFECFAAAVPHLVSMLLAPEGDPDAPDIPTPRSYAEAIEGPYYSQWQAAMDVEMASWKSTGTYVDEVPPPGANIVRDMWIFRVKRPPGSPPVFKAPCEWHDTLRTTLAALGFAPSTADPSLFLRTGATLPPFYVLVYVDDLVFATADTEALAHVKSELQKRHTCTDLGELTSYLGLRITRDRAQRTITLTQSHMVQQVLQRFGFTYSSQQSTPLPTGHSLSAPPSDESVEPSGPYPKLVSCLMYLMTCTRPDLAYPLSLLAHYVAPGRHRKVHWDATKRVLRYLCNTPGLGLVLGGRARVVLTGHTDTSWVDDLATQRSSQGYTFSLGSGSVSWQSTRSSSVLSSSCEAEIYAGAMAAQKLRWLTYLLTDLGEAPRSPPVLGAGPCAYVLRTGDRTGEQCGGLHATQHCFSHLTDAWRTQFHDATEIPRWGDLLRSGVAIFDLDFYAILAAMYAVSITAEGDCYVCVPPDPGIEAAALGASESAAPGAGMASRVLVSGLPRSLPPLPPGTAPTCVPCVEGRQRAAPHSSEFPPTEAPWGPARVRGQGHERYFLLVVDDYSRYTTVFPLRHKDEVTEYAAHQINLQPQVSLPETSPTLRWTGKVGDASAFRVWGSRAFVRDLSADKLSSRAVPCIFLDFPPDTPGWQFYHPTSCRVLSSQDVTFDESVPYYRLFPYRTAPLPPLPLFLAPGPPPVDPLPPQGPAPSGVSQVYAVEPVEVAADSGASGGAEPERAQPGGAWSGGAEPERAEPGGAGSGGAEPEGAEPGGAASGGAEPGVAGSGGVEPAGAGPGGPSGALSRRELPSPQELREWFSQRWSRAAGAAGAAGAGGFAAAGSTGAGGAAGADTGGSASDGGSGATGPGGARTGGTGAAGPGGAPGAGATGGAGAGGAAGVGATRGTGAGGPAGARAAGGTGAGGAARVGADAGGTGVVPAGSRGVARPRPYFVPLLEQVLGLSPSSSPAPSLECPPPVQSESHLQLVSPLPAPSPYAGPSRGLAERRDPESCPALPVCTSRRVPRPRPPVVPGTHQMELRPSTAPQRVPLPSPPDSSLPALADPASDSLRAASPTVTRVLATVVTDPSFESTAASALVAELVDFTTHCRLDYAASLLAESVSVCPPSVGDPDAPDIPTPRSYAEAIEGPYSSQWQAAMDAEMDSWMSTGTYVDEVPPPRANIVSGMWIFKVKRPPGSPPVFKARYVARGFSQQQGVDYFQTFSPTPKMTTLRVLLHVAAQHDYEVHSLDFSTAFLQGSLHEEIWLRRPPGFTGSFPPGTQWSLRRPVYGLRQAPREWHDTLRTTLAALGFAPSTADPSLFLRTDTSLPLLYNLVYVDDLVFATADTAGLAHVKSKLQKRHTCTDLGELRSSLGLQITRDRARRTITLTQSHMVQQVLQRFNFTYSSPQATPLSTRHSLSALPSDESVEPSGLYPELVGCPDDLHST
ncbi:unnamed protein product [Closterium sp. NIES-54]